MTRLQNLSHKQLEFITNISISFKHGSELRLHDKIAISFWEAAEKVIDQMWVKANVTIGAGEGVQFYSRVWTADLEGVKLLP